MQAMWSWLGLNLARRARAVAIVGLLVTAVLGFGITKLDRAAGQDTFLDEHDHISKDSVTYQKLFGGDAMVTLVTMDEGHSVVELFTPANLATWTSVEAALGSSAQIFAVVSPRAALELTDALVRSPTANPLDSIAAKILLGAIAREPTAAGKAARTNASFATLQRLNAIPPERRVLSDSAWVDFLLHDNDGTIRRSLLPIFPDERHAQMVTRLQGNQPIDVQGATADLVEATTSTMRFANAGVITTGAPVLLREINDYLSHGMLLLGGAALALTVLILVLLFDVRWRLLSLGVIALGLVWSFGLAGYLGIPLTILTIAGLPVMLGVGISYAVQVQSRFEEAAATTLDPGVETARNLGPALLVVTFDGVLAFLALVFSKVPMIRQFGLLLGVGTIAVFVCSFAALLAALGARERRTPTPGSDFAPGRLGRLMVRLGNTPARVAVPLALASMLIFAGGVIADGELAQSSPVEWVNQRSKVIHDLHTLEKETASSGELGVFIESTDIFSDTAVSFVHGLAYGQLRSHPHDLLTASSIVTTVSLLLETPGASLIPPTGADVRMVYDAAPAGLQRSTANLEGGALNVIFRTGVSSPERSARLVDEVQRALTPPLGVAATASGLTVVGVGLLHNLDANRPLLTYVAILLVCLFLAVRLRSVVRALISLVPVLVAVGGASLLTNALGMKLSPMTTAGGPLVVAACSAFSSLILLRFIEERARGVSPEDAVDIAAARTGRAFIVAGLAAIAGVGVLATSSFPLLRDFGIIFAVNVTVALLSALVVLPPMLVWAEHRSWVSRGVVKPWDQSR